MHIPHRQANGHLKILLLVLQLIAGCSAIAQCPTNFVRIVGRLNPLCDSTQLDWASWSTVTPTGGTAVISSQLSVTVTKPTGGLSTTAGMFAGNLFPTQYNVPINNTALSNVLAGLFTFCFSQPVVNPQIALSSIGNGNTTVPVVTSAPYVVIWAGPGMAYPNDTTFVGTEGYTIIQFPGTFTCISFNYLVSENYCNIAFGVIDTNCQTFAIPPVCPGSPDTLHAAGAVNYTWAQSTSLNTTTGAVAIANPLATTTYYVTGTDANNCTASDSFTVHLLPAYNDTTYQSICPGGSYTFNGNAYTQAGNYTNAYQTVNGCDSLLTLHLTTYPVYNDTTMASICQGNSYMFQGNTYTTAGTYTFNYSTVNGCDSTVNLILTVNPVYSDTVNATICQGASYTFAGNSYTAAGSYTLNYQTINGCDSVITLIISVNPVYSDTITQNICVGSSYTYNGNSYTQPGYYPNTLQTVNHCDSVVTLHLIFYPVYTDTFMAIVCPGSSYSYNGSNYSQQGYYPNTLQTVNQCDSVVTVHLIFFPVYSDTISAAICPGGSYSYNGNSYAQPGYYPNTLQSVNGCDSVVTVHLVFYPVYNDTITAGICQGNSYSFLSNSYTTAGYYTVNYTSISGCDSNITLLLTVHPTYHDSVTAAICNGQTYTLPDGSPASTTGAYNTHLSSINSCDSLITTLLQVNPTYNQSVTDTIYGKQTYVLPDGSTVTGGGSFITKLNTVNNCDSIISTQLIVNSEPDWFQAYITPAAASVKLGKTITLTAYTNQSGPLSYTWSPTEGLVCADCDSAIFNGNYSAAYSVMISDTNGCETRATTSVEVLPDYEVFVPNVFTPNNDGNNDQWQVFGNKPAMKMLQVMVYDRQGEKVFESNDINFAWDGTFKGKPAPAGVYVYQLTIVWLNNVTPQPYKGAITLIR